MDDIKLLMIIFPKIVDKTSIINCITIIYDNFDEDNSSKLFFISKTRKGTPISMSEDSIK